MTDENRASELKEMGTIKKRGRVSAHGVQFLNGAECSRNFEVPIILLNYMPPDSAKEYAKGEKWKLWIKLEEAQYHTINEQMRKGLREISIWFDAENKDKLLAFLRPDEAPLDTGHV
jgi:hypothetical protein